MQTMNIKFGSPDEVMKFINVIDPMDTHFEIGTKDDSFWFDAKSIIALFSLDLNETVKLNIHSQDPEIARQIEAFAV